jgi:hypothetical protein
MNRKLLLHRENWSILWSWNSMQFQQKDVSGYRAE